jgi:hypothetical protein
MKKDFSRLLYDKYFGLTNRNIVVRLKNGTVFSCVIIGFYKSGDEADQPYIVKWHITGVKDKSTSGVDPLDLLNGEVIEQKDIAEVDFLADNTVLRFP